MIRFALSVCCLAIWPHASLAQYYGFFDSSWPTISVADSSTYEEVIDIAEDSSGRLVVVVATSDMGFNGVEVHRFLSDGSFDPTFNWGAPLGLAGEPAIPASGAVELDPFGRIFVAYTEISPPPAVEDFHFECVTEAGSSCGALTLDSNHGVASDTVSDLKYCGDQIFLVGTTVFNGADTDAMIMAVDEATLMFDTSFGVVPVFGDYGGGDSDRLSGAECRGDGLVAVGTATDAVGSIGWAVALTGAGDLDPGFSGDGRAEYLAPLAGGGRPTDQSLASVTWIAPTLMAAGTVVDPVLGEVAVALNITLAGDPFASWGDMGWFFSGLNGPNRGYLAAVGPAGVAHLVAQGEGLGPVRGGPLPLAAFLVPFDRATGQGISRFDLYPAQVGDPSLGPTDVTVAAGASRGDVWLANNIPNGADQDVAVFRIEGDGTMFFDGFESGDLLVWSSSSP